MKSVILLATPLKMGRKITNQNVENVILIQGELDNFGAVHHSFENNPHPVNEFHIFIKDCKHEDYSYDPNSSNIDPKKRKAATFLARLMAKSANTDDLNNFLLRTEGITYNSGSKIFTVDLERLVYNE